MLTAEQVGHFHDRGYVVIDGVRPDLLQPLRDAADRVTDKARRGDWPAVRRCGEGDIWGVSSLLDPALGEPVFGEYLASDAVLLVAQDLLQTDQLRLSLTNMLVNPGKTDHAIAWHRDSGDPQARGEAELAFLRQRMAGVQWNAALWEEDCLFIVPGTHRRNLTDAERDVLLNRPEADMPCQLRVRLEPGQTVSYNALLLHRGVYPTSLRRRTLHANFVSRTRPETDDFAGHYEWVKFMAAPGFRATIPQRLHPLLDRWLEFAEQFE